jgi:uncharacterized protein (DUF1778 family)
MDKIYRRKTQSESGKINDNTKEKKRVRSVIMNFRVSPMEKALIDARISVTGLSRSEFFISSCLNQEINVAGNVTSFMQIDRKLKEIFEAVKENSDLNCLDEVQLESLKTIVEILNNKLKEN